MIFHTKLLCVPLHVRFNKTDEFIKIYNGTRYLVLFGPERMMQFMIELDIYLISEKSAITYSISHNSARIKTYSYNSLPIGKTSTFHNVIILIPLAAKSIFEF